MKAAVIGAGLIGRAWAVVFARGGADVALYDQQGAQADAALAWAARVLPEMEQRALIDDAPAVLGRIHVAVDLKAALAGAQYVQENIAERAEPKQLMFAEIERLAGDEAVLASSSSAIKPSVIFGSLATRARCLVAHPMNPPHLAPIVELSGADFTAPETIEKTSRFMDMCGMSPVKVEKEIDGFILNRLQFAVFNEAFRLIEGGYVSPRDLDLTIKEGLGLRWSFMGPIETMDLNAPGGVADYMRRYGVAMRSGEPAVVNGGDWTDKVADILAGDRRKQVALDRLGDEQAKRDRRLMALAQFKKNTLPS